MASLKYAVDYTVYPSARLSNQSSGESRRITEKAFTSIIRNIVDVEGFVVDFDEEKAKTIEFVLGGYHYVINDVSKLTDGLNNHLYVGIVITPNEVNNAELLSGLEELNVVTHDDATSNGGLNVADTRDELLDCTYVLHLLEKVGGKWTVPNESYRKFDSNSIGVETNFDIITCGTI